MKIYIISSTAFRTKAKAEKQIREWQKCGTLSDTCSVFETEDYKVYKPKIKLCKI